MKKSANRVAKEIESLWATSFQKKATAKLYEYEYNGMKFYTEKKMPQGIRLPAGKAIFTKNFYPVSGSLAKDLQMDTSDQKDPNDLLEWLTGLPNPRLNEKKSSTEKLRNKLRNKIIGRIGDILEEEGTSLLWSPDDDMLERATALDSLYGEFNEWFASMTATSQEMKGAYLKGYKEGLKDELTPEQIDEEVNKQEEALQRSAYAKIPVFKHLPAKVAKEVSYKWGYWSAS